MADRHLQNSNRNNQFNLLKTDITDSNSVTQRKDIENFIHRRFAESYDANIRQFMPILLCLKDQSSSPRAALGLRPASNEKLFLENYLDQPVEKLLSSMANKTISRSEIIEVGNLAVRRDFSDVRDVVRAYVLLITDGQPGQVYNVGSGESHAIQEVLDNLVAMSNVPIQVQQDPQRMRPSDVPEIVCDASRLREHTGWHPTIPFEQSMKDILDYWRQETARQN